MKRILLLVFPSIVGSLLAQTPPPAKPAAAKTGASHPAVRTGVAATALNTDDQKTIYALGASMYQRLAEFNLSPSELAIVKRALSDAAAGKPAIDVAPWQAKIEALKTARAAAIAPKRKAAAQAYLTKAAVAPGAIKTGSGLVYRDLRPGTGASPAATDTVKVNYRGTFPDGTEFDSSYKRNEPATFPLDHVIPCWTEGVQKMKVGGKASLVCPSAIAYGDGGRQGIPGGSTLLFEIELLEVVKAGK